MCSLINRRRLIGITLTLALVSFAGHAGEYLNADEIRAHFTKITTFGTDDGVKWKETYQPDGKIVGKYGAEKYRGKWKVTDGMMCLDYAGAEEDGCWRVKLGDDNTILWFLEDGAADGEDSFVVTQ